MLKSFNKCVSIWRASTQFDVPTWSLGVWLRRGTSPSDDHYWQYVVKGASLETLGGGIDDNRRKLPGLAPWRLSPFFLAPPPPLSTGVHQPELLQTVGSKWQQQLQSAKKRASIVCFHGALKKSIPLSLFKFHPNSMHVFVRRFNKRNSVVNSRSFYYFSGKKSSEISPEFLFLRDENWLIHWWIGRESPSRSARQCSWIFTDQHYFIFKFSVDFHHKKVYLKIKLNI